MTSVLCIMVGWAGVLGGYREVSFYQADFVSDPPMAANADARQQEALTEYFRAERRIRDEAHRVRLPLAIANMLLSGLLVFAISRTFAGRPEARSLALQALGANGLLAAVDYTLSRGMRGDLVPVIVRFMKTAMKSPNNLPEQELDQALSAAVWMGFRAQLAALLVLYGLAWWALSTQQARAYFSQYQPEPAEDDEEI